ncbi:hypothetical protein DFP72DRAFT_286196 [Ephemerocybe angulata]|uniref:Uncharacterized protein n=1 Tax=Ephemerocybe angulata TaxID=980116 RepID=A0A8H6M826_9AGAR|nr:hypothetical protein DFP72DRAFT_286196 [Tulosesus angulatus]
MLAALRACSACLGPSISARTLHFLGDKLTPATRIYSTSARCKPPKDLPYQPLRRQLSSSTPDSASRNRNRRPHHLSNLDPKRVELPDLLDISDRAQVKLQIKWTDKPATGKPQRFIYMSTGSEAGADRIWHRFPPGTRGFLYFHRKPGRESSHLAGEIRFRVVDSSDLNLPAQELFAQGHDLQNYGGHAPWRIPLVQLLLARRHEGILDILVRQGLITPEQKAEGKQLVLNSRNPSALNHGRILEDITDPFIIPLPSIHVHLTILRNDAIETFAFHGLFWREQPPPGRNAQSEPPREWKGHALLRFELADIPKNPRKKFNGHKQLVLRILKLVDQLGSDGTTFHLPDSGDFVRTRGGAIRSWDLDIAHRYLGPSYMKILEEGYSLKKSV